MRPFDFNYPMEHKPRKGGCRINGVKRNIKEMKYLAQDIAELYRKHGVIVVVDDNGNAIRYERREKHYLDGHPPKEFWEFWVWVAKYMEEE